MDSREGGADVSILHVDLNSFYAHCAVVESGESTRSIRRSSWAATKKRGTA